MNWMKRFSNNNINGDLEKTVLSEVRQQSLIGVGSMKSEWKEIHESYRGTEKGQ
jgi:hypothetical protein